MSSQSNSDISQTEPGRSAGSVSSDDRSATSQSRISKSNRKISSKSQAKRFWRYKDGALPNILAMAYASLGHAIALLMLGSDHIFVVLVGLLLTSSTLVVAAYLIHELAHSLVFYKKRDNIFAGEICSWICGTSYASFERIQRMHMRHHADRADIACVDYKHLVLVHPFVKRCIFALEWLHVPAVELFMHYQVLVRPFTDKQLAHEKKRVLLSLLSRLSLFLCLFSLSSWALLAYAISYLLFIKLMYLGDAFAHTYDVFSVKHERDPIPKGDRNAEYDRLNTYSNIVSRRWSWLNLYNLNFGYHNAHHDKPATPWYRLPEVQKKLYDDASPQYLPYRDVLVSFHKNRTRCILPDNDDGPFPSGRGRADHFLGVHGVSFLSII